MTILISFLVFLLSIFLLSRDDFILLRRNITQDEVFDSVFLASVVALFFARVFYILLHPKPMYLSPLVFFIIPYFPGLSLAGLLIGASIFLYFYHRSGKKPLGRLFDIFSLSFLFAFSTGMFVQAGLSLLQRNFFIGILSMIISLIALVIAIIGVRLFSLSTWRDGSMSLSILSFITILSLIYEFVIVLLKKTLVFNNEIIVFFLFLIMVGIVSVLHGSRGRKNA